MISACSDVGVLIGGFVLRLLVPLAALPVTMTVAWTLWPLAGRVPLPPGPRPRSGAGMPGAGPFP